MKNNILNQLQNVWSSTHYKSDQLTEFATKKTIAEARRGLAAMCVLTIVILLIEAGLYIKFELDQMYLYTCAILIVLSINILISSRSISEPRALHLLGITLLVVSATAFVLLAHYQHEFHPMLFASIALLFMVVPMMPWGLREALVVTLLIYLMFTLSTLGASFNFADQSLWTLQFIMLGTGVISLSLVARNIQIRKHDLETQHDLIVAHERITHLSRRDPLTGVWNRRYFDDEYCRWIARHRQNRQPIHFVLLDIDDFKLINDKCGHESGDRVLKLIGQVFDDLIGDKGNLIRMGGDEFAVVFATLDPLEVAKCGLEKLRSLTSDSSYSELVNVGLSYGVASVPPDIEVSYRQLYKQADLALYQAKSLKGKNPDSVNIFVSVLHNPDDIHNSTQRLWNSILPITGTLSTG